MSPVSVKAENRILPVTFRNVHIVVNRRGIEEKNYKEEMESILLKSKKNSSICFYIQHFFLTV